MVFVALLWASVAAAEPDVSGTWVLVDDSEALAQTHARAVEAAVASLPWLLRPLGRPFLKNSVKNCGTLAITLSSDRLVMVCDAQPVLDHVRGSQATAVTGQDGTPYALAVATTDTTMQLTFTGAQGGQTSHFRREGDALVLHKEIFSPRLPQSIVWDVRYARQ